MKLYINNMIWAALLVTVLIGVAVHKAHKPFNLIIVDAGSSGSRANLFLVGRKPWFSHAPRKIKVQQRLTITPGISEAFNNSDSYMQQSYFKKILNFDSANLSDSARRKTEVWVLATAGMRSLPHTTQEAIIKSGNYFLHQAIKDLGYTEAFKNFSGIKIISGTQEGLFGWLAANYLDGNLTDPSSANTHGVLDLGGISTEITFLPQQAPNANFINYEINSTPHKIYSHSYPRLGLNKTKNKFVFNAPRNKIGNAADCLPRNARITTDASIEIVGKGDFHSCTNYISENLQNPTAMDGCKNIFNDACNSMGSYQPPLAKQYFIGISGFYYTYVALGLANKETSLEELQQQAVQFCRTPWNDLVKQYNHKPKYLLEYCFNAAYINALLKAYGFTSSYPKIVAVQKFDEQYVDWTIGAVLFYLSEMNDAVAQTERFDLLQKFIVN